MNINFNYLEIWNNLKGIYWNLFFKNVKKRFFNNWKIIYFFKRIELKKFIIWKLLGCYRFFVYIIEDLFRLDCAVGIYKYIFYNFCFLSGNNWLNDKVSFVGVKILKEKLKG